MNNKAKYLIYISCLVPVIIAGIYGLTARSPYCFNAADFKKQDYSGILIEKYRDQKNHRTRTLKINQNGDVKELLIFLDTNFYNNLKIGDIFLKKETQESIEIHRGDTVKIFKINFGCDELEK